MNPAPYAMKFNGLAAEVDLEVIARSRQDSGIRSLALLLLNRQFSPVRLKKLLDCTQGNRRNCLVFSYLLPDYVAVSMLRIKLSDLLCEGLQNTLALASPGRRCRIRSGVPMLAYRSSVNAQFFRDLALAVAALAELANPMDLKIMYHMSLPGCNKGNSIVIQSAIA